MDWQTRHRSKQLSLGEAISLIPRGKHIFLGSGAAEPLALVGELVAQHGRLADNTIMHLLTFGPAPYVEQRYAAAFRHNAFFIGPNVREAVAEGRADYTPVFLSQIPGLMRARRFPIDVALIQASPPDAYGYVNLGVSVDIVSAAVEMAALVIAEINPRMPVVHGDGFIPMDRIDAWVEVDRALPEVAREPLDEATLEIGRHVATLVEDGATLQVGIGQIPDAVMRALRDKRDLGVWSEMISDGVMDLVENGNVTGKHKTIDAHRVSSSFCFGTQRLYDFVDKNPALVFRPSDHINDPVRVSRQHRMVAVNSALSIDLTGQVCADSIGTRFYSGIGGQVDFIRGASMCPGGKPIIAMRSTAKQGTVSRIAGALEPGAGVVTSRGDVRFVVTEHGIADLLGKSVRERAMALISIAHPDYRPELLSAAKNRRYVFADQIAPRSFYPSRYQQRITTRDGIPLSVRPIRVTDEAKMRDLFYCLSEDTVYKRWLSVLKRMPHRELQKYLDVDYRTSMALVVETTTDESDPEIVAVARYALVPATDHAEIAFVVHDAWQGRGIGTSLMKLMTTVARDQGFAALEAHVLADNSQMMRVFHQSGLEMKSTLEGGVYKLVMPLGPRP